MRSLKLLEWYKKLLYREFLRNQIENFLISMIPKCVAGKVLFECTRYKILTTELTQMFGINLFFWGAQQSVLYW